MPDRIDPIEKAPEQWEQELPPERYRVLFEEGTEPPRSSPLNHEKREGTYVCAACGFPLFRPMRSTRAAAAGPASCVRWQDTWR